MDYQQLTPPIAKREQESLGQPPDESLKLLQRIAPDVGLTVEEMVAEWQKQLRPNPWLKLTAEERAAARSRLQRHAGPVSLGYATGIDNESIDADLARE